MSSDEVRRLLSELGEAIHRAQADGRIDDEEREQLGALTRRVERALSVDATGDDGEDEDDQGVVEHLEATAVRFEGDHPGLAQALRAAVNAISGYGI